MNLESLLSQVFLFYPSLLHPDAHSVHSLFATFSVMSALWLPQFIKNLLPSTETLKLKRIINTYFVPSTGKRLLFLEKIKDIKKLADWITLPWHKWKLRLTFYNFTSDAKNDQFQKTLAHSITIYVTISFYSTWRKLEAVSRRFLASDDLISTSFTNAVNVSKYALKFNIWYKLILNMTVSNWTHF